MLDFIDKTAIRKSLIQLNNLLLRRIYSVSKIHLRNHPKFNIYVFKYFSVIHPLNKLGGLLTDFYK